ncbi:MAG: hypothetical protein ACK5L0_07340 [Candidatus Fimivivens sp.]
MIRAKIFEVNTCSINSKWSPIKEEMASMEAFIEQIGYDCIKNIVSGGSSTCCYYTIFYEDGLPYTPYVKPEPPEKPKKEKKEKKSFFS